MKARLAIAAGVLVLAFPLAAAGRPPDAYLASIAPGTVMPKATATYAITITNKDNSPDQASQATVVVPDGFTLDPLTLTGATSAAGSCSASTWTASFDATTAQITAASPGTGGSGLCPGAALTIQFDATAPEVAKTYTWATQLSNSAANFALSGAQPSVTVSGPSAPTITQEPPPASNTPSATFAFTGDAETVGFQCRLDGGAFAACGSPVTYDGLADGSHTFGVEALDDVGNASRETTYSWTVDTVAPAKPTIASAPPPLTNDDGATFGFSDAEPGVAFQCRLDGAAFSSCVSPTSYSSLGDGTHTFDVRAVDAAGNSSETASDSWTVDTVPPAAPTIDSEPPSLTASTSASFTFTGSNDTAGFECKLDDSPFSSCTSPQAYSPLADGSHTFAVEAVDAAGNTSDAATWTWTVDTQTPVVTITSGPPDPTNAKSATFTFSSSKSPSAYACSLDGAAFTSCSSPQTYDLGDGRHTFQVRATDTSTGTTGTAATYRWTVDTVPPPAPGIAAGPAAATKSASASFVFSDSEPSLAFRCQLDGAAFAPCTSPASYGPLADGAHTFGVRAVDAAGNAGAVTSFRWVVDTVAPETQIVAGPARSASTGSATFTFTSSEAGGSFICTLDGAAPAPCVSPQTYGSLGAGSHSFTVAAVDAAGNVDATPAAWAWTVATATAPDTTPPGRVTKLVASVGYGVLRLSWKRPPDADFDHVQVLESTSARGPLRTGVYTGSATIYTSRRFRNGSYARFGVVSYDHAGNQSDAAVVVVSPSALLRTPRDGSSVSRPPLLSWTAVSGAAYYNVQLYRGSQKVLSAWPAHPQLQLRRLWTYGGTQRLQRGAYRWFVWPAFGTRSRSRYGQVLGYGTFVVR